VGEQAEIAGKYLRRGSQVFIEGKVDMRDWTDKEGKRHTSFEIVCENFRMLGDSGAKPIKDELREAGVWPAKSREQADQEVPF
jgi:single-strand DNA-binding protein